MLRTKAIDFGVWMCYNKIKKKRRKIYVKG